jgi:hypothetical protein
MTGKPAMHGHAAVTGSTARPGHGSTLGRNGRRPYRLAVAGSLVAILVAACGASDSPANGVATIEPVAGSGAGASASSAPSSNGDSRNAQMTAQMLAYAQCMRHHGLPNFPDPAASQGGFGIDLTGIDPEAPVFQAADEACQSLMPTAPPGEAGGLDPEVFQQLLAYARCMRDHGVPNFPDPGSEPNGSKFDAGQIYRDSPTVQAAEQACASNLPGLPGGSTSPSNPGSSGSGGQPN